MITRNSRVRDFTSPAISAFLLLSVAFFTPLFTGEAVAEQQLPSPMAAMQSTLDQLVDIVISNPGEANAKLRQDKMRTVIEPKFDFEEMSKRSLGMRWKTISQNERDEFVDLFSELLARTYLGRIDKVKENMVEIKSEVIKLPRALVKTVVTYEGDNFPLDYKLIYKDGSWRVYDVIIENIGLISNYKSEFAGIIRKEDFSGLLAKLREKNALKPKSAA